jgi:hypothetical protein
VLAPSIARGGEVVDLASTTGTVRIDAVQAGDDFGVWGVACDVDGDGLGDLVVGAEEADGPSDMRPLCGEVSVVPARRGAWSARYSIDDVRTVWIIGEEAYDSLGRSMTCGDLNGDGRDDLILGAWQADSIGNTRPQGGQDHVLFGGQILSSLIDLAVDPGTVVYGARPDDLLGLTPDVGDVNGDGIDDLLEGAYKSASRNGLREAAGRAHVLFGRLSWPLSVDLGVQSDVTFWGRTAYDFLGLSVAAGDLDRDGTDDLLVAAPHGDGLNDSRDAAGDINVFFGRSTWPPVINLAQEQPDMLVYGADVDDRAGEGRGAVVGDFDGDGEPELAVGHRMADGPLNSRPQAGEVRLYEPRGVFPLSVDLRTKKDSVIYGSDPEDKWCNVARRADVNGDGTDDLLCASTGADGPNEARTDAGEIAVFFGRDPFPAELDLRAGAADILIYGEAAGEQMQMFGTVDLNGDGLADIAAGAGLYSTTVPPKVWVISPFDVDGDGILQLPDNCPLVANPDQFDGDGDGRGDACATDWDGDGLDDALDCAPANARGGRPSEVQGVVLGAAVPTAVSWDAAAFADRYEVSRGLVSALSPTDLGECQTARDPDPTDTVFVDGDLPPAADAFFYLIRAHNRICALAGTWGASSDGAERVNQNPAACP